MEKLKKNPVYNRRNWQLKVKHQSKLMFDNICTSSLTSKTLP